MHARKFTKPQNEKNIVVFIFQFFLCLIPSLILLRRVIAKFNLNILDFIFKTLKIPTFVYSLLFSKGLRKFTNLKNLPQNSFITHIFVQINPCRNQLIKFTTIINIITQWIIKFPVWRFRVLFWTLSRCKNTNEWSGPMAGEIPVFLTTSCIEFGTSHKSSLLWMRVFFCLQVYWRKLGFLTRQISTRSNVLMKFWTARATISLWRGLPPTDLPTSTLLAYLVRQTIQNTPIRFLC